MKRQELISGSQAVVKRLKSTGPRALVWFRSDLRILDQPALFHASQYVKCNEPEAGVIGLYVINRTDWQRHALGSAKIDLILGSLKELQKRLEADYNIPLLLVELDASYSYAYPLLDLTESSSYGQSTKSQTAAQRSNHGCSDRRLRAKVQTDGIAKLSDFILTLIETLSVSALFYNREYEYDEALRDKTIKKKLVVDKDIHVFEYDDQCLVKPGQVATQDGRPYQVFTPFKKGWLEKLASLSMKAEPVIANAASLTLDTGALCHLITAVPELASMPEFPLEAPVKQTVRQTWPAEASAIMSKLQAFVGSDRILSYKTHRDFPALSGGTSQLSAYLSVGSLAPLSLLRALLDRFPHLVSQSSGSADRGESTYLSELCWREFYRHILYHFPRVSRGLPFQPATLGIQWRNDLTAFEHWKAGTTGYPIVDAAMRQLKATRWMHNRCRMIVASFLTKDLLIDWRWGERYFSESLVDSDLASNNGGWQWSASTGTDAQPYFRIFSPLLQSERFDPKGLFIRQWVPELQALSSPEIHAPYERVKDAKKLRDLASTLYPKPIVDHAAARLAAIAEYKRAIADYKQG